MLLEKEVKRLPYMKTHKNESEWKFKKMFKYNLSLDLKCWRLSASTMFLGNSFHKLTILMKNECLG